MDIRLLIILALFSTAHVCAQIPNGGFEDWTTVGDYMEPDGFLTTNSVATTAFYPVTRSTDHYPVSVGNYSLRLENNTSLLPNLDAFGFVIQNNTGDPLNGSNASFPVIGHPTSLNGYYKCSPVNGDTMLILMQLYLTSGTDIVVSFLITDETPEWTSFSVPFPTYDSADSASIRLAAYNSDGPPPAFVPYGNSVLYVDNLSFDDLITSVSDPSAASRVFTLYPNPASDIVSLDIGNRDNDGMIVNVYDVMGARVKTEMAKKSQRQINIAELSNGAYMVEIISGGFAEKQRLIVQR